MKRYLTLTVGILCLLGVIGVTMADLFQPPADQGAAANDARKAQNGTPVPRPADEAAADKPVPDAPGGKAVSKRARALRLDKDGFVVGYVNYVDPYTLNLEPVPDAIVTFMQNLTVVTQAKTGPDGRFALKGLTAHASYSVFVRSPHWVAMFGTYTELYREDQAPGLFNRNQLAFMGNSDAGLLEHAEGDPQFQAIQCVPWEDFFSAFKQDLFGELCSQDVTNIPYPGPRGDSSRGFVEGAYAAAAVAAIAGGIAATKDEVASPFGPKAP